MTKKELLELLKDVPDDGLIVVNGHSDGNGYCDCDEIEEIKIIKNHSSNSFWRGKYVHPYEKSTPEEIITTYVIS
jgi:hypothetical protein